MAAFTFIEVRSGRKLPCMFIDVAVEALPKLDLVNGRLARRYMALLALHFRVLAFQRVLRCGMILNGKGRWFPPVHSVARRTLTRARTLRKLAIVWVWDMAIDALGKRDWLLEIAVLVARAAGHFDVLSEQGKLGLRVIELLPQRRRVDLPPTRSVMARLARALKLALVRIGVAVIATAERQPFIARRPIRPRRVALLALHLHVRPGERIPRLAVIELGGLFPVNDIVALNAILPQLSFVKILMARHAVGRQPKKGPCDVLHLDLRAFAGNDVRWGMAFRTCNARVLPFQFVTSLVVIKSAGIEAQDGEIHSIMFGVAARAILRTGLLDDPRMVATTRVDPRSNLSMTLDALESDCPAKLMAGRALRNPIKRLVGLR